MSTLNCICVHLTTGNHSGFTVFPKGMEQLEAWECLLSIFDLLGLGERLPLLSGAVPPWHR